ncbi:DUF1707 domain-containing protein [Umezawaea endophytica]|uniref:DUF1707 domain-containing protein n=1 Tax=Umezawaea endophytica TaxID=1654476 RepID=A0A9X2VTN3_9PSEU|nr:DUF1707 domain-containing protein [Umezawaea endophytica]MCS7482434.1 DUF1707 domain-containing protein [Umezawaea endophytica]
MAVVDFALARGLLDQDRYEDLRQAVAKADYQDLPAVVADLPAPRWDAVPVTTPVDDLQREFAITLLDIAAQYDVLSGADRKWRTAFAARARTAADLLVLFLDVEPHLRRRRNDPAMLAGLERLAFVSEILQARGRGGLSREGFDSFLDRAALGEDLDTLRAELDSPNRDDQPRTARPAGLVFTGPAVADPPALDLDRARIAKYLEQALSEGRLGPGEHAARTILVWSATTARDLAKVVVDLPLPADEPLRDPSSNQRADHLVSPVERQTAFDWLDRAMAGGALTLWEYETRLDVAVRARTVRELARATAHLPPG